MFTAIRGLLSLELAVNEQLMARQTALLLALIIVIVNNRLIRDQSGPDRLCRDRERVLSTRLSGEFDRLFGPLSDEHEGKHVTRSLVVGYVSFPSTAPVIIVLYHSFDYSCCLHQYLYF